MCFSEISVSWDKKNALRVYQLVSPLIKKPLCVNRRNVLIKVKLNSCTSQEEEEKEEEAKYFILLMLSVVRNRITFCWKVPDFAHLSFC